MPPVVLLGLGFTTQRLAKRLLVRGHEVHAVTRNPGRFGHLASVGLRLSPRTGAILVHSVPPAADMHEAIADLKPRRVLYISSTGVYGSHSRVDETTPVDASGLQAERRIAEEDWLRAGPWQTLIVRPAAIYGPGRGVHTRIAAGEAPRGAGAGMVSRIHVDDLAAVLEAGISSDLEGAWPLADERPCSSGEVAEWCWRLLRKSGKWAKAGTDPNSDPAHTGREVDGRAIRELLGVALTYPDYRSGILASLSERPEPQGSPPGN